MSDLEIARLDWKTRIRPAIERAVKQANRKSGGTKIELSIKNQPGQIVRPDETIELPGADVSAYRFSAKSRRTVARLAGSSEGESRQQRKLEGHLQFGVLPDGRVQMTPFSCDVKKIGPLLRDQFTDQKIELAINKLIDCLRPHV
jgi:hypothetical protein